LILFEGKQGNVSLLLPGMGNMHLVRLRPVW